MFSGLADTTRGILGSVVVPVFEALANHPLDFLLIYLLIDFPYYGDRGARCQGHA